MDENLENLSKEELIYKYKKACQIESELLGENERLQDELMAKEKAEINTEIDYKKEYEVLTWQLHCANDELNQYKHALLNVCSKI